MKAASIVIGIAALILVGVFVRSLIVAPPLAAPVHTGVAESAATVTPPLPQRSAETGNAVQPLQSPAPAAPVATSEKTTAQSTPQAPKTTPPPAAAQLPYAIVGTDVTTYYGNSGIIAQPTPGAAFYGQDATYELDPPSYTNNGNGTITDNITGLMWQQNMGQPMTLADAEAEAKSSTLGGYHDWRVANIKELYSLIVYTGEVKGTMPVRPFIDTAYFDQPSGGTGTAIGDRPIDAQTLSATPSVALTMGNNQSTFGVNFVDGHLKAYPDISPTTHQENLKYYRLVRGDTSYGVNDFVNNGNGTITDRATGLMWQQEDSGTGMDWEHALAYCEDLSLAGHSDWRLPSAKELESIVDYSRSPETTDSAAINPMFQTTQITDPDGTKDYPFFWSATTFLNSATTGDEAAYVAFGRSVGKLANGTLVDAHGAGAVRSDPKTGNPADYPQYFGPQNDLRRVFNFVRCVRTS